MIDVVEEDRSMATSPTDLTFLVQTDDGPVQGVVSTTVLSRLSGRSHVTGAELLQVYRTELEDIVQRKVAHSRARGVVRIEAADL
jgi:hypothetical protein